METLHCGEGDGHPHNQQHIQFVHTQGSFKMITIISGTHIYNNFI